MDASELLLQKLNGKHLVIIAGVGGNLMAKFVKAIHQQNPHIEIDFLLCPVLDQFILREQLIQLNFSLLTEALMVENQRFYEILLVSNKTHSASRINSIGSLIWQVETAEQSKVVADYLRKTVAHYKRIQLKGELKVQHVIDAYSAIIM